MELRITSGDLYVSAWMDSFIQTTIQFGIWRATPNVEQVSVRFVRTARGEIGCHLEAWRGDGSTVRESGWSPQAFEAIQAAADKLEMALFTPCNDGRQGLRPALLAA